jgi:CubicO group peptidase (beta-lactamase class C family)
VSLGGRRIADFAVGEARPGVPASPDTLMPWFCVTKPVVAAAVLQLWERGRLELDDPVTHYLPEFGASGKEGVTVRHLLTHTSGFPWAGQMTRDGWVSYFAASAEQVLNDTLRAPLQEGNVPGRQAAYHPISSWYVLGALVERLDGRPCVRYVREEIFEPLGMEDSRIGVPDEEWDDREPRIALVTSPADSALPIAVGKNLLALLGRGDPASGGCGPMRDMARFWEMLLFRGQRQGVYILSPQVVDACTAHQRAGIYDSALRRWVDWGLGLELDPELYSAHSSSRVFGHSGAWVAMALADPTHGLVAAFATNGILREDAARRRYAEVSAAIYEDLGLALSREAPANVAGFTDEGLPR